MASVSLFLTSTPQNPQVCAVPCPPAQPCPSLLHTCHLLCAAPSAAQRAIPVRHHASSSGAASVWSAKCYNRTFSEEEGGSPRIDHCIGTRSRGRAGA